MSWVSASDGARPITAKHIGVCGNFATFRSPLKLKQSDVAFNQAAPPALDATAK